MNDAEQKITLGKSGVAVGGASVSQGLEQAGSLNMADIASLLTILFVAYQLYAMFYDRNIKPRGGWRKIFKK